jgi:hypothetical protein
MSGPSSFDDAPAGLERVTDALRRMPAIDPRAIDRTVAAALARRRVRQSRRAWLARAAGLALAVGLAGGGVWVGRRGAPTATSETATTPTATDLTATLPTATAARAPSTGGPARLAGMGRGEDAPVAVAFALRHPGARRVSLVGDFDVWSPTAAPMRRLPDGTWTTTVALAPGRHAYAFVVDDSVWVTDPTAPLVHDPDYGRDHSVIVVGQP